MIGNGGISPYRTHSHEHNVTKCLHQTYDTKLKSGGSMSGGSGFLAGTEAKAVERFSVTDMLSGVFSKSSGLFGKIRGDGQTGDRYGDSGKHGLWNSSGQDTAGIAANVQAQAAAAVQAKRPALAGHGAVAEETAAVRQAEGGAVMATAAVRLQKGGRGKAEDVVGTDKKAVAEIEKTAGDRRNHRESLADGEFRKKEEEAGKVRKFLRRFGKTAVMGKLFRRGQKEEAGVSDKGKPEDFLTGDSSYLLDSYNCSGEYSTLAKDRSLEGRFRALG